MTDGMLVNHTNAGQLQPETLEGVVETRALFYQLMQGRIEICRQPDAFMNAIHGLLGYHNMLRSVNPQNDFERKVIEAQLRSYQEMFPNHLRI